MSTHHRLQWASSCLGAVPCPRDKPPISPPTSPWGRRNQNYLDILRLLSLGDKQLSSFDISLRFTHLFWFGDLNYRLDMDIQVRGMLTWCGVVVGVFPPTPVPTSLSPQEILNYISRKELEPLLKVDQLNLEKEKHKVFLRFGEGHGMGLGMGQHSQGCSDPPVSIQARRRSPSPQPTATNAAPGTPMSGTSRSLQG